MPMMQDTCYYRDNAETHVRSLKEMGGIFDMVRSREALSAMRLMS